MGNSVRFTPWPSFGGAEIAAAAQVLKSGKINQWTGKEVFTFEREYAGYLGVTYAVAVVNGSVALDLALLALGIGPGDEVIVPCRSFVASASCVALRGAVPVFADIDRNSQNLTVDTVAPLVSKRTRAVIAVHLAGWPCDLAALRKFCDQKKLYLIEDCAQAHGARYRGRPAGSFGDISCFSFCQDKIITTGGEGGLLVTNNRSYWKKAWQYKDHGRDPSLMSGKKSSGRFVWSVQSLGTNYRMTEMQAALGRIGLKNLDSSVQKRRALAQRLHEGLSELDALRVVMPGPGIYHAYYKYYVFVRPERLKTGWNRDRLVRELNSNGIPCGCGVCPEIYREKGFVKFRERLNLATQRKLPVARELGKTSIMFQVHPTLQYAHMEHIVDRMKMLLKK